MVFVFEFYENELSQTLMLAQPNNRYEFEGSDNPKLGTKALTQIVREVLEEVFEARIREISETLQGKSNDCRKKIDRSSPRLEPRSMKHVKMHFGDSKGITEGATNEMSELGCGHYKKCHSGNCWKKLGSCLKYESREHRI
ncbi:hypothetical protein J1N35_014630 [Gossypium stocksii]|uniref:Uncharacterized protein n=1 Tax=Gossypium stocksii TaxID=47602 RepID=A0A9D3VXD0_9ROSI|nr:hypothetical protein J1N35_014630 [Gossypium stocksii]